MRIGASTYEFGVGGHKYSVHSTVYLNNYFLRYLSPLEKDASSGNSPTSLLIKKQRETSDTPVLKALRELDEKKKLKNWGTQTEKEDTSNS